MIHLGDCLEIMPRISDRSVDMVLCDLPYGTTRCKWDIVIPLEPLWESYLRILKKPGCIVLTATQPFASALIQSRLDLFRYDIVWDKVNRSTGYANAKRMPLRRHEHLLVFYRSLPTYNPQMTTGKPYKVRHSGPLAGVYTKAKGALTPRVGIYDGVRFPVSILSIVADIKTEMGLHPTQKPVALMEYLIKTYTNPGDTVLDNCMGSGTTGVACVNTERKFIGIEKDPEYFAIAENRIKLAQEGKP